MKTNSTHYDAIIIGGGPAGSTTATILAMKGRRVIVVEREKFPRYHIGESLIPFTYFTLKRIGMIPKLQASHFPKKYSVQFVRPDGRASQPFYFFKHMDNEAAQTWQVWRGEFDQMLLNNAREKGAEVHEETSAKELVIENGAVVGVKIAGKDGVVHELRAPITVDATGRDAFSIVRHDWQHRDPYLNKVAVWSYFKGAKRDPGIDEGATTVAMVPEKGWFWYIPLAGDVVSVGIVAERAYLQRNSRDPETIYAAELKQNKWIQEHTAVGTRCDIVRMVSEYSYRSKHCSRDGLVLVGDAFQFLDPVFSSGVFIALKSGELAGDAIDAALTARNYRAEQFTEYGKTLCHGVEAMRRLVYAFYDHAFSFRQLIDKHPHLHGDVTNCLIGNLFIDFEPLYAAVAEFAKVPGPLPYGLPAQGEVQMRTVQPVAVS